MTKFAGNKLAVAAVHAKMTHNMTDGQLMHDSQESNKNDRQKKDEESSAYQQKKSGSLALAVRWHVAVLPQKTGHH